MGQSALVSLPPHTSHLSPLTSPHISSHLPSSAMYSHTRASKKTSLNLDMERMKINERRKPLSMSGLSRQARGSSTGSSLSSLSPDDERPKSISSRYSQSSLQQNQRLNKDNLAKLKNRPTKVIESSKKCAGCSKPLKEDGFFALGQLYHKNCFRCKFCKKRLGEKFFVKAGAGCCGECYSTTRCAVCKEVITEGHVTFGELSIHSKCMKCQVCGEQVVDKYLTYKDLPICEKDFRLIATPP